MAITPVALPEEVFQVNKKLKKFQNEKDAIEYSSSEELHSELVVLVKAKSEEAGIDFVQNHKLNNGLVLPVFVPDRKIAFDVISLVDGAEDKVGNKFYRERMEKARAEGIQFIQIFEDEWKAKKNIVDHRIQNLTGVSPRIYARNTQVKEIPWGFAKDLLNAGHIQGAGAGAAMVLGLVQGNSLVAVMTFGASRFEKTGPKDFELIRYVSVGTVIGGFSKLLKYFAANYGPERIISYSDARWSIGNVYSGNGFELTNYSPPGYFWTRDGVRHNRIKFQKHKLKDVLEKFNPMMTEKQNCEANGYKRIFDAGMQKWEMNIVR
jgi:hypothetical protein